VSCRSSTPAPPVMNAVRSRCARISLLLVALAATGCGERRPRVELRTDFGAIVVELDSARAPATTVNFLRYVREGRYAGASFYRVRRDPAELMRPSTGIVQGGLWRGDTTRLLPPVRFESTAQTGLRHEDGTVSMARFDDVNGARAEFFVSIGRQPHLDYRGPGAEGYAAFGRVVEGMEIVRAIQGLPVRGEILRKPVPFRAVRVR